jgi:hypothetical protein
MKPLALTDDQLTAIYQAAGPIPPDLRGAFLESVASKLAGEAVVGDGSVARACREAQREFWKAPDLSGTRVGVGNIADGSIISHARRQHYSS